ncbi:3-oxoadipate enol-lactone hydrolase [Oceanicola granulosus HTCC2516]|uniref:3-oxoadipate enol-lactone hydrolase n=1 Tax=Oceanicola granulosus (strain ATCC BAA-861 / DSM 15982 / KCTC 12143 / HTCC2516) TaxID=314256 RepID=Q2CC72_OCEGH|nr:3-oxoadipate enol-lactonase [Oceanicola granulosus]EAR50288.1 3-oxoadipate enol-lactone hydrolase [Oceanicola granulosus HTCC2516]
MAEHRIQHGEATLFARTDGVDDPTAPTILFANSLGTDLSIWDDVLPRLPDSLRIVRFDKRGHGRSSVPPAPYAMGKLISDAEAVCDALEVRDAVVVGLSIGGIIAQGLAVKRHDIVRAIVLSNTAAKIGTRATWDERIATVRTQGLDGLVDAVMERWFSRPFRESPEIERWRALFLSTPPEGYIGCCAAISHTDFYTPTAALRLPTLGIAGSEDGATPPDLVRETTDLVPGSKFELMRGVGHIPCVEQPEAYARLLTRFLTDIAHP